MHIRHLTTSAEFGVYDEWVRSHPEGSLWQSLVWAEYQQALGRDIHIFVVKEDLLPNDDDPTESIIASALCVRDITTMNLTTWDIPRGPIWTGDGWKYIPELLEFITARATEDKALGITLSPAKDLPVELDDLKISSRHVMPEATRILDLTEPDEKILAQMKPKGRYNIKVAEKHDVTAVETDDIEAFHALAVETAKRDGFAPPRLKQYQAFLKTLSGAFLLLAYHEKKPVAGLLGAAWNGQGIYYYGASNYESRALMAPYLLQWKAMQLCKEKNCKTYDLFGIAPPPSPSGRGGRACLPAGRGEGQRKDHPWSGVSDFKEKFGGKILSYPAEREIVLKSVTKKLLNWKRKIVG